MPRYTHNSLSSLSNLELDSLMEEGSTPSMSSFGLPLSRATSNSSGFTVPGVSVLPSSLSVVVLPPSSTPLVSTSTAVVSLPLAPSTSVTAMSGPVVSSMPYVPATPWPSLAVFPQQPNVHVSGANLQSVFSPTPRAALAPPLLPPVVSPVSITPSWPWPAQVRGESQPLFPSEQTGTFAYMLPRPSAASSLSPYAAVLPPLHQDFVVGPGFLPIPYRTVAKITEGQYVELVSLLAKPAEEQHCPTVTIDGRIILSQFQRPNRRITTLGQWVQAFSILAMILVSYFPERARYIFAYQLLILRMYTQFGGTAWLSYDEAFRRDAAARHIIL